MTRVFQSAEALAEAVVATVGNNVVLGLPIGIGKAVHVADALLDRAAADRSIKLTIFTGLTLEAPTARSDLERRFLDPLVDRLYADWPTPAYAQAMRRNALPPNVDVHEFYLRPGGWLSNPLVQQNYASINYSRVASELLRLGVNVIGQLVAEEPDRPGRFSLASNPEVTLDLLPALEAQRRNGAPIAIVGQVNPELPYMTGAAELDSDQFDFILDSEEYHFPLFGLPNRRVSPADYATGMHVASLVRDGGTLQLGIGSLADAVAHCLRLRHESPLVFAEVLARLPGGSRSPGRSALPVQAQPFEQGLFASTELLSDALFSLYESGLLRRCADSEDAAVVHAGFFVGSGKLYDGLRKLDESGRRRIRMCRISEVNTLFGDERRKRRQRRDAAFVNETMMVTLLGAAVSDALEDGRVVSGVGGQFDFVSMAQELADARSILMCRARRVDGGRVRSNIRWSYGHVTVPRHHRDMFVTEYGIAATRGLPDARVVEAMIAIADSAFQDELVRDAVRAGKLRSDYAVSDDARNNTPDALCAVFESDEFREHFPPYPLGTELTDVECELAEALQWLAQQTARPWSNWHRLVTAVLRGGVEESEPALARMGLDRQAGLREFALRRLLAHALHRTKS